jgi:hypothetical protein
MEWNFKLCLNCPLEYSLETHELFIIQSDLFTTYLYMILYRTSCSGEKNTAYEKPLEEHLLTEMRTMKFM